MTQMKQMTQIKRADAQRGAVTIVEATFVFPIMFIIILMMIIVGEAYYQHARVEYEVVRAAISAAARCENPMQEYVQNNGNSLPSSPNATSVYPYRYIFTGQAKAITATVERELKGKISGMKPVAFRAMSPANASVKVTPKLNVLVSSVQVTCEYDIQLPIRMIFSKDRIKLHYATAATESVGDPSEFVRNVAIVQDIVDRNENATKVFQNLKGGLDKIGTFTN